MEDHQRKRKRSESPMERSVFQLKRIRELEEALSKANEQIKALTTQACPADSSFMDDEDIDKQLVRAHTELSQCFHRISALKMERENRQAHKSSSLAHETKYNAGNDNSTAAKQCTQGKGCLISTAITFKIHVQLMCVMYI